MNQGQLAGVLIVSYRNHPEKLEQKEGITEERCGYLLAPGKEVQFPHSSAGPRLCLQRSQSQNVWGLGLNGNAASLVQQ